MALDLKRLRQESLKQDHHIGQLRDMDRSLRAALLPYEEDMSRKGAERLRRYPNRS